MYYLRYYYYYISYVNCYIIYLIIYKERTKTNREGRAKAQTERQGERNRARDAAVILANFSPLFRSVCRPHRPNHRQRSPFTKSHQHTKNGRAGTLPRLCVMLSPSPRHRSTINKNRGAGRRAVCHPAASRLRPASCCFFPSSSFSSLRLDLFRSLLPDVLPAILPASSHLPGGEG